MLKILLQGAGKLSSWCRHPLKRLTSPVSGAEVRAVLTSDIRAQRRQSFCRDAPWRFLVGVKFRTSLVVARRWICWIKWLICHHSSRQPHGGLRHDLIRYGPSALLGYAWCKNVFINLLLNLNVEFLSCFLSLTYSTTLYMFHLNIMVCFCLFFSIIESILCFASYILFTWTMWWMVVYFASDTASHTTRYARLIISDMKPRFMTFEQSSNHTWCR